MRNRPAKAAYRCSRISVLLIVAAASGVLGGCVAAVNGAVTGGTALAVDRRSTGTQLDDQAIELRAATAVSEAIGKRGHVSVTSYSRVVLLTGQVPSEADRSAVEAAVRKVENVRGTVNELTVGPSATIGEVTNDSILTGKVKAALFDSPALQVGSIKVVTERGVVYLLGRVTEAESLAAGNAARAVAGVAKVVKIFEIITPAELAAMPLAPSPPASAPAK